MRVNYIPKTKTGKRVIRRAKKRYGKKKGPSVMYATANKMKKKGKPGLYKALHGG